LSSFKNLISQNGVLLNIEDIKKRLLNGEYTNQDIYTVSEHCIQSNLHHLYRDLRIATKRLMLADHIKKNNPLTLAIVATSDSETDEFRKFAWGDFWLQYELISNLGKQGYKISRKNPHVLLQLFGFPQNLPQNTYNMGWCTSHPDLLIGKTLHQFDHIFTLGKRHQQQLNELSIQADWLPAASSKEPYPVRETTFPAIFIGNTKPKQGMRPCVQMLKDSGYPFLVWGWGWDKFLPAENIAGTYTDYSSINRIYACSKFVLNDHHTSMQDLEMISPKNFDICSSGGVLICEKNAGIDQIFGDTVPQFSSTEELRNILTDLDQNEEKRLALQREATEISLQYQFDRVVEKITSHIYEDCLKPMQFTEDQLADLC
jgi:hypothetical protein